MRWILVAVVFSAFGCDCSTTPLNKVDCKVHPEFAGCPVPPPVMMSCPTGLVTGKVCSPDVHGPVPGATVTVDATCNGEAVNAHATADAAGNFSITVPAGAWTAHAVSGTFQRDYPVTVTAHMTTALPTDPACSAPPPACTPGTVTGVICAPDQHTFIAGANVSITGTCNGQPFSSQAVADAMGNFTLTNVPSGTWTVHASAGSFMRDYTITVAGGAVTNIPADQLCFQQTSARLGVITAAGDHIETLLTGLGFTPKLWDGSSNGFNAAGGGKSLLMDPNQLKQLDVLFIDCAAGSAKGVIDLGGDQATIGKNLHDFVMNGGSLYASDWAFMYVHVAFSEFQWQTASGTTLALPFSTHNLMGYAAQSVNADIADMGLRNYLNKSTVKVDFPSATRSIHWGLMNGTGGMAKVLISGTVLPCVDPDPMMKCATSGPAIPNAPLAVLLQLTGGPGGNVIYTSFHNISQSTTDVGEILKYLIFKL
jgi:hypothetical protein